MTIGGCLYFRSSLISVHATHADRRTETQDRSSDDRRNRRETVRRNRTAQACGARVARQQPHSEADFPLPISSCSRALPRIVAAVEAPRLECATPSTCVPSASPGKKDCCTYQSPSRQPPILFRCFSFSGSAVEQFSVETTWLPSWFSKAERQSIPLPTY